MNDIIKGLVSGYLDTFDMYAISSPALQQQVDDFKKKMTAFANDNPDIGAFYGKLAESGLMEEHSALITKVVMASTGSADADGNVKTDYSDTPPPTVVSVKEFIEQYRVSYDEVKKSLYRKRGEAAYEKIFAVADRTNDMLEAQTILEEERLLWKIVTDDSLDIFETNLQAMDPLQRAFTFTLESQIDVYKKAQSEEEIDYMMQCLEFPIFRFVQNDTLNNITIPATFAALIVGMDPPGYDVCKLSFQLAGKEESLREFIATYKALQRTVNFLKEFCGKTFDDLLANESANIWMLAPDKVDDLSRVKVTWNPHNHKAFRDIIYNEIMSDLPLIELLKRQPDQPVWYSFGDPNAKENYRNMAQEKATQINAELTYYKYVKQGANM
ncbi:MAG: hypothetical protein FWG84_05645 [Bacteroidales bacterium]|nr:hypothetical protein [Bacteroidales bacterium]